ncbi:MAG TPA: MOSC N-terminal beta barrel domain-containing protein, partial [Thermoleophilaceae bacterium]|nr:MOSC N-terminal beta barrel domain-containing protein [Thermoleophilaceae bacterium]
MTEIWRYPVKSMGGETIDAAAVGERGLHADRMWAVRDPALGAGVLADHYEELGDRVLKMLAEEDRVPGLRQIADRGRSLHRQWCARVFAPTLA